MSTLVYATLTSTREKEPPNTTTTESPPGVKTYVDALAALVPMEVLTLHGLILPLTTKTTQTTNGNSVGITEPVTLFWVFFVLLAISIGLYVIPRIQNGKWDRLDYLRAAIPPLAFIGWTMLQKATAFDAVWPSLGEVPRTVVALIGGFILGVVATKLAYKADQKVPGSG